MMASHTRCTLLKGAAVAAAGSVVGSGLGPGFLRAEAQASRRAPRSGATGAVPFLEGAFAPVTEELTTFDLDVVGRIPHDLDGRYLRNGPNALGVEDVRAHHWMIGDGMVHGVRLRGGRAEWYRNRWVRSSQVTAKLGETYPGRVPPDDFACNTHVIPYKGRILALQEGGPLPYELDGELGTVGPYDFRSTLNGALAAHTKYDEAADELHAIAYYPTWDHVRHIVIDRTGRAGPATRIPVANAPMMHDFALTEKYVVIVDVPITFDGAAAEAGAIVPYVWNDSHPMRIGLLPRGGGTTRWFEIDPVYYSHTLNATTTATPWWWSTSDSPRRSTPPDGAWADPPRPAPRRSTDGRSTCARTGSAARGWTTVRRNSLVSTSPWSPDGTAMPTPRVRPRCGVRTRPSTGPARTRSSATTW